MAKNIRRDQERYLKIKNIKNYLEETINQAFEEKFRADVINTLSHIKSKVESGEYKRKSDFIFDDGFDLDQ